MDVPRTVEYVAVMLAALMTAGAVSFSFMQSASIAPLKGELI